VPYRGSKLYFDATRHEYPLKVVWIVHYLLFHGACIRYAYAYVLHELLTAPQLLQV